MSERQLNTEPPARLLPAPLSAGGRDAQLRLMQQGVIDAELRASRREILTAFRQALRTDPAALAADEFLTLADRRVVESAIIVAARSIGGADACDLQIYDPADGQLRITRQHGFAPAFLDHFAAVDPDVPSACGTALATGEPVLVDDLTTSPIFRGQPTLEVMLAAGSRAVHSYPLHDSDGRLLGMLSLHYRSAGRRSRQERLVQAAARAMAQVPAAPVVAGSGLSDRPQPLTVHITTTDLPGVGTTLTVHGPLDAVAAPGFQEHVRRAVAVLPAGRSLVIDLREVTLLVAAGARAVLDAARMSTRRGIACYLVAGRGLAARTALDRLEITPRLRVVDDPAQAAAMAFGALSTRSEDEERRPERASIDFGHC